MKATLTSQRNDLLNPYRHRKLLEIMVCLVVILTFDREKQQAVDNQTHYNGRIGVGARVPVG
jgi:hypothetical protein